MTTISRAHQKDPIYKYMLFIMLRACTKYVLFELHNEPCMYNNNMSALWRSLAAGDAPSGAPCKAHVLLWVFTEKSERT